MRRRTGGSLVALLVVGIGTAMLSAPAFADPSMTTVAAVVTPIAGGGTTSTYSLPGGQTLTIHTPPRSFSPATASNSALATYGFPARPTGAAALAEWQNAMDAYKPEGAAPATISVPTTTSPVNDTYYKGRWAGFWAGDRYSQSQAFVAVQADVTVPTVNGCSLRYGL